MYKKDGNTTSTIILTITLSWTFTNTKQNTSLSILWLIITNSKNSCMKLTKNKSLWKALLRYVVCKNCKAYAIYTQALCLRCLVIHLSRVFNNHLCLHHVVLWYMYTRKLPLCRDHPYVKTTFSAWVGEWVVLHEEN